MEFNDWHMKIRLISSYCIWSSINLSSNLGLLYFLSISVHNLYQISCFWLFIRIFLFYIYCHIKITEAHMYILHVIYANICLFCSCYANAVLQCLTCTKPLVIYLLHRSHSGACTYIFLISLHSCFATNLNDGTFLKACILFFSIACM